MAKKQEKSKEVEEPVGYNLNVMTLGQLKCYAHLLEDEIEDMRKHCNFYQKTEDELFEVLSVAEDELKWNELTVLSKEAKLERMKLDFLGRVREKREWPEYMEHRGASERRDLLNATEGALHDEANRHLEEARRLQTLLKEKDRELESLHVKIELARKELQDKNEADLERMDEERKRLLDASIQRFDAIVRETELDFLKAMDMIRDEATEARIEGERDLDAACEAFKRKLQAYYQEVTRQDLDSIRKVKGAIRRVEDGIRASKQALKVARGRNAALKADAKVRTSRAAGPTASFGAEPLVVAAALEMHNRTERLALENQGLEAQIKARLDQICDLRKMFTMALEKVRESAERKVGILQQKLDFILEEKGRASSCNATVESSSAGESVSDSTANSGSEST